MFCHLEQWKEAETKKLIYYQKVQPESLDIH